MSIKAIFFDLGETLLNYGRVNANALFREGARLSYEYLGQIGGGRRLPGFEWYFWKHIVSIRAHYVWSNVVDREFDCLRLLGRKVSGLGFRLTEGQLAEVAYLWYKPLGDCAAVESDLHQTLGALQGMGLKLGIISNTFLPGAVLDRHLTKYGVLDYFTVRVYSSETVHRKPDERIYRQALGRMGVSADEAMMVGDKVREDILGARSAGLRAVLKRGPYTKERRCPAGVAIIDAVSELPELIES